RPAGPLSQALGHRTRVPGSHGALWLEATDRQHAGGDDLPGRVLPGAVQLDASGAAVRGGSGAALSGGRDFVGTSGERQPRGLDGVVPGRRSVEGGPAVRRVAGPGGSPRPAAGLAAAGVEADVVQGAEPAAACLSAQGQRESPAYVGPSPATSLQTKTNTTAKDEANLFTAVP